MWQFDLRFTVDSRLCETFQRFIIIPNKFNMKREYQIGAQKREEEKKRTSDTAKSSTG